MTAETESKQERNRKTACEYAKRIAEATTQGKKEFFDKAFELFSDDFEMEVLPSSLNMPKMNKARYRKWIEPQVTSTLSYFTFEPLITVAEGDRVIMEGTSHGTAKDGRPYGMEYRISFEFDREGKIKHLKEFVDSLYTARFYGLIQEK